MKGRSVNQCRYSSRTVCCLLITNFRSHKIIWEKDTLSQRKNIKNSDDDDRVAFIHFSIGKHNAPCCIDLFV